MVAIKVSRFSIGNEASEIWNQILEARWKPESFPPRHLGRRTSFLRTIELLQFPIDR